MPGPWYRTSPDQAGKATDERHGGAVQRSHQRRAGDPALYLRRGPGADAQALRLAVQSPYPSEGPASSITDHGDEGVAGQTTLCIYQVVGQSHGARNFMLTRLSNKKWRLNIMRVRYDRSSSRNVL